MARPKEVVRTLDWDELEPWSRTREGDDWLGSMNRKLTTYLNQHGPKPKRRISFGRRPKSP